MFVSKKLHERMSEYIHIDNLTQTNVWIHIFVCKTVWIFQIWIHSNIQIIVTLWHTHEYVRRNWLGNGHERMPLYICIKLIDTDKCPNEYLRQIYSNIQILLSHSDLLQVYEWKVTFIKFSPYHAGLYHCALNLLTYQPCGILKKHSFLRGNKLHICIFVFDV